jgi:hypothetical protein
MYPHERSLVKQLSDKPFALIGVNSDRDLDSIREIVKEKNITWRSFWNGPEGTSGPISTAWNVSGWPTIYVLDGEGRIRFKNVRGDAMDKALETLLAEMKVDVKITHEEEEGEGGGEQLRPAVAGKAIPAAPILPPKGGK